MISWCCKPTRPYGVEITFGQGTLVQRGNIRVNESTTLDVEVFDWGNNNQIQIDDTREFVINSRSTRTSSNEFLGFMRLIGGTLEVNFEDDWLLAKWDLTGATGGTLRLQSGDVPNKVRGADLNVEGHIVAEGGRSDIEANLFVRPSAQFWVGEFAEVRLAGNTEFSAE